MAEALRLTTSLQVAVLAVLVFDQAEGTKLSAQIKTSHFDGAFRDFAAAVLKYRKTYHKAPGGIHLGELMAEAGVGKDSRQVLDKLLIDLEALKENLNAEYIASRAGEFVRRQLAKTALIEASDVWETARAGDPEAVDKIEKIFREFLSTRGDSGFEVGTFLSDPKVLRFSSFVDEDMIPLFMDTTDRDNYTGLDLLTRRRIGLYRKQLFLFVAPKGQGKTWMCISCGKAAIAQGKKVVHYTLEMDGDTMVLPRYVQSLWGVGRDNVEYQRVKFKLHDSRDKRDQWERTVTFNEEGKEIEDGMLTRPWANLMQRDIVRILKPKRKKQLAMMKNLVVKTFHTGAATIDGITAHLDYLADAHKFYPDLVIVDYPKLMKTNPANLRTDIGHNVERLRGLAGERNFALFCPHQSTRKTIGGRRVYSRDVGEDISVIQTADTVVTFQRTEAEAKRNIGRLSVEHAREAQSALLLCITQSYATGQFATSACWPNEAYQEAYVKGKDDADTRDIEGVGDIEDAEVKTLDNGRARANGRAWE